MPKDIIITPASGLVDFKDNSGISSATIQLDDSGNLNISNPGGNLTLGDTSTDIFVGDGINNVDIVFEQDGEIRGLTNTTVSLGQTDSYIKVVGGLKDSNNQVGIAGSILVSTGAGVSWTNSLGAITFTGAVSFGTSAYFGDNDTLYFGDGNDLRIYHDGSHSYIRDAGTGHLYIGADDNIVITNSGITETKAKFITNGSVELYYDNTKEFETTGYGVPVFGTTETQQLVVSGVSTFQGNVDLGDDDILNLGDSSELQIRHRVNGDSSIVETGSGALYIGGSRVVIAEGYSSNLMADFTDNGSVDLYHNHIKKFETTGYGATVFGTLQSQGLNVSGVSTISVNSSIDALRITQTGAGNALVVEDSANPDATPFVIRGDGNVGIGTTNPSEELHIVSSQPLIRFTETDGAADNRNWNVGVNNQEFYWQALTDAGSGGGNLFKMTRSATEIQTFEGRNAGNTWFIVNNNTQRVGIGTTNPTSKLSVVGDALVTGVVTATSFVKSGGTSSEFLKADGSVDSSTYLTTTGSGTNLTGIVTSIVAGDNITISGSTGQVTINSTATGGGGGAATPLDILEVMLFA